MVNSAHKNLPYWYDNLIFGLRLNSQQVILQVRVRLPSMLPLLSDVVANKPYAPIIYFLSFLSAYYSCINKIIFHLFNCLFQVHYDGESLFLGFLKEDLFYFFQIIFQDFLIFIYLYRIVLFLADITSMACLKQFPV